MQKAVSWGKYCIAKYSSKRALAGPMLQRLESQQNLLSGKSYISVFPASDFVTPWGETRQLRSIHILRVSYFTEASASSSASLDRPLNLSPLILSVPNHQLQLRSCIYIHLPHFSSSPGLHPKVIIRSIS